MLAKTHCHQYYCYVSKSPPVSMG